MQSIPHAPGIYQILCVPTGKIYIGSTQDINKRWRDHRCLLRCGRHENSKLQRAWNKYGEEAFAFSILELVLLTDVLLDREQRYLDRLKPQFNIARSATAWMRGRKMPKAFRDAVSERLRGNSHAKGSRRTDEWKAKYAGRYIGRKHRPESIAKMKEGTAASWTDERKRKHRDAQRLCTPETVAQVRAAREAGMSMPKIADAFGISYPTVRRIVIRESPYEND